MGGMRVPKPTLLQRSAAAVNRTILNFGDEVYGVRPDREAHRRRDQLELTRHAEDEARGFDFLDEVMPEHTDLITSEDEYGTEFRDVVQREFVHRFKRDLTRHESDHLSDFMEEWFRDQGGEA